MAVLEAVRPGSMVCAALIAPASLHFSHFLPQGHLLCLPCPCRRRTISIENLSCPRPTDSMGIGGEFEAIKLPFFPNFERHSALVLEGGETTCQERRAPAAYRMGTVWQSRGTFARAGKRGVGGPNTHTHDLPMPGNFAMVVYLR